MPPQSYNFFLNPLSPENDLHDKEFKRAYTYSVKAKEVGFYWSSFSQILDNVSSEIQEVHSAYEENESKERIEEELGDALHALLEACFYLNFNPEKVFQASLDKFSYRFQRLCHIMTKKDIKHFKGNTKLALQCWEEAKLSEIK